jgi:hypothetical protein
VNTKAGLLPQEDVKGCNQAVTSTICVGNAQLMANLKFWVSGSRACP